MSKRKILFIDRDGTLINEPADKQIDTLAKLQLEPNVIPALLQLKDAGFNFVIVSNQDGLGTANYSQASFDLVQTAMLQLFNSQGITFEAVRICPHWEADHCECRKPRVGLLLDYLSNGIIDNAHSYVIGDRETDLLLAEKIGVGGILYDGKHTNWHSIAQHLTTAPRCAEVNRTTKETSIKVAINLDDNQNIDIKTGIGFFDHMLEQLAKHGGFSLRLITEGDLHIDDHHTIEDTALAIGAALNQALGDKTGINRYGFLLPMDEALCQVALDLSGRPFCSFTGQINREKIGDLSTELIPHFFRSLAETLKATLHIQVRGENAHHIVESIFKGVGRTLRMAIHKQGNELPSTKGIL